MPHRKKAPEFRPCDTCIRLGTIPGSVSFLAHLEASHGMNEREALHFVKLLFERVAAVHNWGTGKGGKRKKGKSVQVEETLLDRISATLTIILQTLLFLHKKGVDTAALSEEEWGTFRADRISLEDALRKVQM